MTRGQTRADKARLTLAGKLRKTAKIKEQTERASKGKKQCKAERVDREFPDYVPPAEL